MYSYLFLQKQKISKPLAALGGNGTLEWFHCNFGHDYTSFIFKGGSGINGTQHEICNIEND